MKKRLHKSKKHVRNTCVRALGDFHMKKLHVYMKYKIRKCGMIVHETAIHQMTVEFELWS